MYSIIRTQNALADAARASRFDAIVNCAFCEKVLVRNSLGVVGKCSSCGAPQPVSPNEDYFSILGSERKFKQSKDRLETVFYSLSKELHPDRFATGADPKWKTISLERMSRVNDAYRTLTKKEELRTYLLGLYGFRALDGQSSPQSQVKPQIPLELAEEWFEIQEAVMENPDNASKKIQLFEQTLDQRINQEETIILGLEDRFDLSGNTECLSQIEKSLLESQYLRSLKRDVLKLKDRIQ